MKSIVLVITVITAAAGGARATEMVEVPNAPPYVPPPKPTLLERKNDEAAGLLAGGIVMIFGGLGIEAGAVVYAVDNPCVLPLACIFGPPNGDQVAAFAGLALSGALVTAGGITLTAIGGSHLRRLHRPISVRLTGTGLSLSGRF